MKNFITIGKFVFAFLLLCSSSALAYDQQYQPGDTGPNGGIITQVTVTSTDGDPVITTVGDQQTTTIETTYIEEIIEATTNEVVTTQITQVETREVSGTTTTDNILEDIDPSYSGDVHNYGSSDSVSGTMLIFGPNGGTVTSQFNLNSYMTEEQWQGGFNIDTQADMLNCFNTQTLFQCDSNAGGPADSFTITITVTDGNETFESITNHTIDNGPFNFESYSASLTVPQNTMDSSAIATIQGYGYDVGNYDLSGGTRGDGQPTYLGPLMKNPSITITHNLYQTVIQQIEQQITNTITEYITTQLTSTESDSTTITIETEETTTEDTTEDITNTTDADTTNTTETETVEITIDIDTTDTDTTVEDTTEDITVEDTTEDPIVEDTTEDITIDDAITKVDDDNVEDDTVTEIVDDVVETIIETITETIEDQDQGHDNSNSNDNNNSAGDWSEPEPEVTIEVESDITEITVDLPNITEDTEIVIVDIEEDPLTPPPPKPEITQEEIDNILDTIEVVVSDSVGDIIEMTVDLNIDNTGSVQIEIVNVNMAPEVEMTDMASPMPQSISTEDMSTDTSMTPPPMELPVIDDMPDMMPEMPEMPATGTDIASNIDMPDINASVDMQAMESAPPEMVEAISEAVTEMANLDAAPIEMPVAPRPTMEPQANNDSPAPIEVEATPQPVEVESQQEPQTTVEVESQPSEPEPQQQPEPQQEPEQTAESQPQQQESEPEQQTAEAQPKQETSQNSNDSEPQKQETASNESKNDSKDTKQETSQKAESKQTKTKTVEQKKEMKQKIAQKILTRVLQNQNVTMSQVDATRLTLMTSLADTAGFSDYQNVTLQDRTTWYVDTQIYDLPQMVDPFADILIDAQNMQMDSLIDSQYKD
jgi:hypothetical protein